MATNNIDPKTGLQGTGKVDLSKLITADDLNSIKKYSGLAKGYNTGTLNVNPEDYDFQLRYDGDNDQIRAINQSFGETTAKATGRFIGTTLTKTLQSAGYLGSLPKALITQDINVMLDNSFSQLMANAEEDIKEAMPIHKTRQYYEGNLWEQMGTYGFWYDDAIDGLAFLASSYLGTKGLGAVGRGVGAYSALGKGMSAALNGAKTGKLLSGAANYINVDKVVKGMDFATTVAFNTASEAAFEAKDTKTQVLRSLQPRIDSGDLSIEKANEIATNSARNTFWWNMAAIAPSNMLEITTLYKKYDDIAQAIGLGMRRSFDDAAGGVNKLTLGRQIGQFGKRSVLSAASEGLYEENIQHAVQSYFTDMDTNFGQDGSLLDDMANITAGMVDNFSHIEGQKAIALGSIIGFLPGGVRGVVDARSENKTRTQIENATAESIEDLNLNIKDYFVRKTELVDGKLTKTDEIALDKEGIPIINIDKVFSTFVHSFESKKRFMAALKAVNSGNKLMFNFVQDQIFAAEAFKQFHSGVGADYFKAYLGSLKGMQQEDLEKSGITDTSWLDQQYEMFEKRADKYQAIYDSVMGNYGGRFLLGTSKEAQAHRNNLIAQQFNEGVMQDFWENTIVGLEKSIKDIKDSAEVLDFTKKLEGLQLAEGKTETKSLLEREQESEKLLAPDKYTELQKARQQIADIKEVLAQSYEKMRELLNEDAQIKKVVELEERNAELQDDTKTDPGVPTEEKDKENRRGGSTRARVRGFDGKDTFKDNFTAEDALVNDYEIDSHKSYAHNVEQKYPQNSTTVYVKENKKNGHKQYIYTDPSGKVLWEVDIFNREIKKPDIPTIDLMIDKQEDEPGKLRELKKQKPLSVDLVFKDRKLEEINVFDPNTQTTKKIQAPTKTDGTKFGLTDTNSLLAKLPEIIAEGQPFKKQVVGPLKPEAAGFVALREELEVEFAQGNQEVIDSIEAKAEELKRQLEEEAKENRLNYFIDYFADHRYKDSTIGGLFTDNIIKYLTVIYNDMPGLLSRQGNNIIFTEVGFKRGRIKKVGEPVVVANVNEVDLRLEDLGIYVARDVLFDIEISNKGNTYTIHGEPYHNYMINKEDAIEEDAEGNPIAVTLVNSEGTPVRITAPHIVDVVAYNIELFEVVKEKVLQQLYDTDYSDFVIIENNGKEYVVYRKGNGYVIYTEKGTILKPHFKNFKYVAKAADDLAGQLVEEMANKGIYSFSKLNEKSKDELRNIVKIFRSPTTEEALEYPDSSEVQDAQAEEAPKSNEREVIKSEKDITDASAEDVAKSEEAMEKKKEQDKKNSEYVATEDDTDPVSETVDPKEASDPDYIELVETDGVTSSAEAVTYVKYENGEYVVLNKEFGKYVIKEEVAGDEVEAIIDVDNEWFDTSVEHKSLRAKIKGYQTRNEPIPIKEIEELLETTSNRLFTDKVDEIPIKLIYNGKEDARFKSNIYFHRSDYDSIGATRKIKALKRKGDTEAYNKAYEEHKQKEKRRTRKARNVILTALLSNELVTIPISFKTTGKANNVGKNNNILDVLKKIDSAIDPRDITIGVVKNRKIHIKNRKLDKIHMGKNGNVFLVTNHSASGQEIHIKLNPQKISREHAIMAYLAIRQGQTDSLRDKYVNAKDIKNPDVRKLIEAVVKSGSRKGLINKEQFEAFKNGESTGGLSNSEVLQYLMKQGPGTVKEQWTEDNKHLQQKQVWISEGKNIRFGAEGSIPLHNPTLEQLEEFLDWAQAHKNYPINHKHLESKSKKAFTLGTTIKADPAIDNYNSVIIKSNMVMTDVDVVEGTKSLTKDPVVVMDVQSVIPGLELTEEEKADVKTSKPIKAVPRDIDEKQKRQEKKKPTRKRTMENGEEVTKENKLVTPEEVPETTPEPIKEAVKEQTKNVTEAVEGGSFSSFSLLAKLPAGSVIYLDFGGTEKAVVGRVVDFGEKIMFVPNPAPSKTAKTVVKDLGQYGNVSVKNSKGLAALQEAGMFYTGMLKYDSPAITVKEAAAAVEQTNSTELPTEVPPVPESQQPTESPITTENDTVPPSPGVPKPTRKRVPGDITPRPQTTEKPINTNIFDVPEGFVNTGDTDINKVDRDLFPFSMPKEKPDGEKRDVQLINTKKAVKWLKKLFPGLDVRLFEGLIEAGSNRVAYGQARHDSILLSALAEAGTEFHEAFHRVSLFLLTEEERSTVYEAARKKWPELEGKTLSEVEEFIADQFKDYMLAKEAKVTGPDAPGIIKRFFKRMWDWIVNFFTGPKALDYSDMEALFSYIEKGKFSKRTINKSAFKEIAAGKYANYLVKGVDLQEINNEEKLREATKEMFYMMMVANRLVIPNPESGESMYNIHDLKDLGSLKFEAMYELIQQKKNKLLSIGVNIGQARISLDNDYSSDNLRRVKELFFPEESIADKDINAKLSRIAESAATKIAVLGEILDNKEVFSELLDDYLLEMNIEKPVTDEELEVLDPDAEINETNSRQEQWDKSPYEVNAKETAAVSVKLLLTLIPDYREQSELLGFTKFVEQGPLMDRLYNDLRGAITAEQMLERIEEKSKFFDPYRMLANFLRPNQSLLSDFYKTMKMNKMEFVSALADAEGKRSKIRVINTSVDVESGKRVRSWNNTMYRHTKVFKKGENKREFNSEYFDELSERFDTLLAEAEDDVKASIFENNFEEHIFTLWGILHDMGIKLNEQTIPYILDTVSPGDTVQGFFDLLLGNKDKNVPGISYLFDKENSSIIVHSRGKLRKKKVNFTNIFTDMGSVKFLAKKDVESDPHSLSNSVLGAGGNRYFAVTQHTYMTNQLDKYKDNPDLILERFANMVYNGNSVFLKQLIEGDVNIDDFHFKTLAKIAREDISDGGRKFMDITEPEDYAVRMSATHQNLLSTGTAGDRNFFTFFQGFKKTTAFIDKNDNINEEVLNIFVGYANDEYARIKLTRDQVDSVIKAYEEGLEFNGNEDLISTLHYIPVDSKYKAKGKEVVIKGKLLKDKNGNYTGRGTRFTHFTDLNKFVDNYTTINIRERISDILFDRFNEALKQASDFGFITYEEKDGERYSVEDKNLPEEVMRDKKVEFKGYPEGKIIDNAIFEFMVNNMITNIEESKLFTGDPANFQNAEDKVKRLTGYSSTGFNTRNQFPEDYFQNDPLIHSEVYNVATLSSVVFESDFYKEAVESFVEIYVADGMNEKKARTLAESQLNGYKKVDQTDGQTFITPEMYRALSVKYSMWSDAKEEAFKLMMDPNIELTPQNIIRLSDIILQPLKTMYMNNTEIEGQSVITFDKMSMAVLFRPMLKGTQLEKVLDRMELKGEYSPESRRAAGLDVVEPINQVKFDTATKAGNRDMMDLYTEEGEVSDLGKLSVFAQDFDMLRHQLVTDPHLQNKALLASQFKKMGFSNANLGERYEDGRLGSEIVLDIQTLLGELSNRGKDGLVKDFNLALYRSGYRVGDKKKLMDQMTLEGRKSKITDNQLESLKVDDRDENQFYLEPASMLSNHNWIPSKMISLIKKNTIDVKLPGNVFIQVSNVGIKTIREDSELRVHTEEGYMEAKVSVSAFKTVIPDYKRKTHQERVAYLNARPELIAMTFRVPVQGQNSTFPLKIVGFTEETAGDIIYLPAEGTTTGGFDFDIDKLYLVRHNYRNGEKIEFLTEENATKDEIIREYAEHEALKKEIRRINLSYKITLSNLAKKVNEAEKFRDEVYKVFGKDSKMMEALQEKQRAGEDYSENIVDENKALLEEAELDVLEAASRILKLKQRKENLIKDRIDKWVEEHTDEFFNQRNDYERNTQEALQNKLLDSYFTIALSKMHFTHRYQPLDHAARELKKWANEVEEAEGVDRNAPLQALQEVSPVFQMDVKKRMKLGRNLGGWALAGSHHVVALVSPLHLNIDLGIGNRTEIRTSGVADVLTYPGEVSTLKDNQVFVFGSNPIGVNGNPKAGTGGAALWAHENAGVEQGEKMDNKTSKSGKAYGLTTVTAPGRPLSISKEEIIENIKEMYATAEKGYEKEFLVAYTLQPGEKGLNGYTGKEMAQMFVDAGPIPTNVIFNEEFARSLPGEAESVRTVTTLSEKKDSDNDIYITDFLSSFVSAHVDLAKDAFIASLNTSRSTQNQIALLARSGVPGEKIMKYISQPILKEFANAVEYAGNQIIKTPKVSNAKVLDGLIEKYTNLFLAEGGKKSDLDYLSNIKAQAEGIFNIEQSIKNIEQSKEGVKKDADYYRRQLEAATYFQFITPQAEALFQALMASRIDNKKFGITPVEIYLFRNKINKVLQDEENGTGIIGMKDFLNNTFLNAYNENAVTLSLSVLQDLSLEVLPGFTKAIDTIVKATGREDYITEDDVKDITKAIRTNIMSDFFVNEMGLRHGDILELMFGNSSIPRRVDDIKNSKSPLAKNPLIKALVLNQVQDGPDTLLFEEPDTKEGKNAITRGWRELFGDRDNPANRELAYDLFYYSYLSSGFQHGLNTFFEYTPHEEIKTMGLDSHIKKYKELLLQPDYLLGDRLVDIYKNNWNKKALVPQLTMDDIQENSILYVDVSKPGERGAEVPMVLKATAKRLFAGVNEKGESVFAPFVNVEIQGEQRLFKYVGYKEGLPIYMAQDKMTDYRRGSVIREDGMGETNSPKNRVNPNKDERWSVHKYLHKLSPSTTLNALRKDGKPKYREFFGFQEVTDINPIIYNSDMYTTDPNEMSKLARTSPLKESEEEYRAIVGSVGTVILRSGIQEGLYTLTKGEIVYLEATPEVADGLTEYNISSYGYQVPTNEQVNELINKC